MILSINLKDVVSGRRPFFSFTGLSSLSRRRKYRFSPLIPWAWPPYSYSSQWPAGFPRTALALPVLPRAPPRSNRHNGVIRRVDEPRRTSEPNVLYR